MELQIDGRNLEIRNAWQGKIEEEKDRLERHHAGLVHHLRVTIEETSSHKEGGYEVRLVASVPNDTLVVKRKGVKARALLVEAFDTLGLQLKELQRKRRDSKTAAQEVGAPGAHLSGVVKAVFPFESYGFILTPEGREVYFHENALKDIAMSQLSEGLEVKFAEGEGDKGPTATWVRSAK